MLKVVLNLLIKMSPNDIITTYFKYFSTIVLSTLIVDHFK